MTNFHQGVISWFMMALTECNDAQRLMTESEKLKLRITVPLYVTLIQLTGVFLLLQIVLKRVADIE
jgi:hypothetical protein